MLRLLPEFDSHVKHVEEVLQRFRAAGLKLKPRKCKIFQRKVRYLGHIVRKQGVAMDAAKVAGVKESTRPTNLQEVKVVWA